MKMTLSEFRVYIQNRASIILEKMSITPSGQLSQQGPPEERKEKSIKTFSKTWLPDNLIYNGKTYTLDTDLTELVRNSDQRTVNKSRLQIGKNIVISVLSKNLRGRLNFHNKPYQPSEYVFTAQ